MLRDKWQRIKGFTIVELIVVIGVIAILVTVGIISYGAWRQSTWTAQVKNELNVVSSTAFSQANFNSGYPATAASSTADVVIGGGAQDSGRTFCIDASSSFDTSIKFYVDNTLKDKGPQPGTCADRTGSSTYPNVPTNVTMSSTTANQIVLTWTAATGGPSNYDAQCAVDAAYIVGAQQASSVGAATTAAVTGLTTGTTYNCRVRATNANGASAWSAPVTAQTVISFGTMPSATNLRETLVGSTSSNVAWDAITCSLGSAQYRFVWVSPTTTAGSWGTALTAIVSHDQGTTNTWKVEAKCAYMGVESSVSSSSNRVFASIVAAPSGSLGTIGWNDRFVFNSTGSTLTCTSPAVLQYQLNATLIDATSGAWTYGWGTSTSMTVNNANQGSRMTTFVQARCLYNSVSSTVTASSPRTDNASVDAPGAVPGWCVSSCGSPRGDRWSAVSCPAGTYAVYWAYLVGDGGSPAYWGAYEAAGFYGYDRGAIDNSIWLNDYVMARCTSAYRTSAWGPQNYTRF